MQLARDEFEQGFNAWLNSGGKLIKDDASTTLRQVDPADWQAQREPFTGHLWLQCLNKVVIGQHDAEHTVADDSEQQQEAIEPQDEAVTRYSVPDASPSSNEHIYVDLHIVYSPVYRVPVLYFRGRLQDGSVTNLQSLLDSSFFHVARTDYPLSALEEPIQTQDNHQAHFPAISQGDHPQTGLPCFYLHPCETSAALQDVLASQEKEVAHSKVIETWLMLISTIVDIK